MRTVSNKCGDVVGQSDTSDYRFGTRAKKVSQDDLDTQIIRRLIQSGSSLHDLQAIFRRSVVQEAIRLYRTKTRAAQFLKVHRNTLERIYHHKEK